MGFPRQGYWNGLPFPSPGGLPEPGIERGSPALQADSLPSEPPGVQMQLIISQFSLPFSSYVSQYTCVAPTKHLHVPHRLFCFSEQRNKLEAADLKKETNPKKVSL